MRTFLISLLLVVMVFSIGISQENVDVVYLKNGDIRKGIITENVPNDYLKVETSDGSLFTIKYSEIEKITKETRTVNSSSSHAAPQGLMARTHDIGITAGIWLGGEIYISRISGDQIKEPGVILRAFYDEYLIEKLGVGVYANYSSVSAEGMTNKLTMFEFGGSVKPRFPLNGGKLVLKIGANIGYRMYSSDVTVMDQIKALGLNCSIELQINTNSVVVPFVEVGFLSQPVGGNDYTDITSAPIIYVGAGVAF